MAAGFQDGPAFESEFRVVRADDGRMVWLANRTEVLSTDRLVGVNFDITARKMAEQELAESERRLRIAVQAGNMAVWDPDGPRSYAATAWAVRGVVPDQSN